MIYTIKQIQEKQDETVMDLISIMFKSGDDISVSLIQRKCKAGYNSASRTFEKLINEGLITNEDSYGQSKFI